MCEKRSMKNPGLRQVSLTALSWEPEKDARLVPTYTKTLTTIAELGLVCGLALSNLPRAKALRGVPCVPAEGFSLQRVNFQEADDKENEIGLGDRGVDWLGLYIDPSTAHMRPASANLEALVSDLRSSPANLSVYLHLGRCRRAAEFLGVHPKDLVEVVWTHEAAHFVSHVGHGGLKHLDWRNFWEKDSSDNAEDIAQRACWAVFTVFKRPRLLRVMRQLSPHLSGIYKRWEYFEKRCAESKPLDIIGKLTLDVAERSERGSCRSRYSTRGDLTGLAGVDE